MIKPIIKGILTSTARLHGVTGSAIIAKNRLPAMVKVRDDFIRRARYYGFTEQQIGDAIGRHPSTVNHSLQKTSSTIGEAYQ